MPTDNHDLNTPAEGSTNWHIPLNENFDALEIDVIVRGDDDNIGSFTPHQGAAFLDEREGNFYTADGSDWNFQYKIGAGGGSAILLDLGDDGSNESTDIDELATSGDTNSVITNPSGDKALIDLSKNVPGADQADGLSAGALDAIGEIDAALRSGADATLITGTAGTDGNVPEFNADGDIVDSGKAAADIGSGSAGVDVENTDGTTLVSGANPIQAGTDLDFTDDTDGSVTLDYVGASGSQKLTDTGTNNVDGGDIYELPQDIDSILAQFQMELVSQNLHARDDRPLFTTDDRTVFVDPSSGSDTNDGTSGAPLKTLKEAMRRVPFVVQHDYIIDLADGTYANADEGNSILGPPMILAGWQGPNTSSNFKVRGNQTNPENVIIEAGIGIGIIQAEEDDTGADAVFSGFTLRGDINCKAGKGLTVDNVRFTGTTVAANHAIQGKGDFSVTLRNCEFDTNRGHVAHFGEHGGEIMMKGGNTGTVSEYTYWLGGGATGRFSSNGDQIGQKGQYQIDNGAQLIDMHGQPRGRDVQLTDDWDDGRWDSARIGPAGDQHRPEWSDAGTNAPSVTSDGKLLMPANSKVNGPVHPNLPSEVTFDYQWQSDPTSGTLQLRWGWDFAEYWQILIDNGTDVKLQKRISSTTSDVISGTGSDDTSEHEMKITRSESDAYEIFEDGTSLGTASDSDYPSRDNAWEVEIRNEADAGVTIDNLFMGTWPA